MFTILSVGYSLAPVGPDAVGGSEQVLSALDHALVAAGHRSIVIAPAESTVAGELVPIPATTGVLSDAKRLAAQSATREVFAAVLRTRQIDLVHCHGLDFPAVLPEAGPPLLATLHLPPAWYAPEALAPERPATWVHCVSEAQHRVCPPSARLLSPIPNGVALDRLTPARHPCRGYALMLGRICPEKGQHLAIAAAREAEFPLLIAGTVFAYAAHQAYFDHEIAPLLDPGVRLLGPVGLARKRRLLAAARCLLVPSQAPETSSLVAMEAAACGTPVIAYPNGALPEIVVHGRTGFVVSDTKAMAAAIRRAREIDPGTCRREAEARFALPRMVERYFARYESLIRAPVPA